ncbi:MAG: peptidoglycan DD-metalloendopeptidase family protein [Spirosomataceae bacterium]
MKINLFKYHTLLLFVCLIGVSTVSFSQNKTRQQLEQEKKKNLQKINEISEILDKTTTEKKASVSQLKAINRKIETQSKQIDLIEEDLTLLDKELKDLDEVTIGLSNDLSKLRKEYAEMIYAASKTNNTYNRLMFLFSAKNFNQLFRRYNYLQEYSQARKTQVAQIEKVRTSLLAQQVNVKNKKQQQQQVLTTKVSETQKLEGLKDKQSETVAQLSQQEQELRAELNEQRNASRQLDRLITTLIEKEIRESRRREEERRKAERERLAKLAKEKKEEDGNKTDAKKEEPTETAKAETKAEKAAADESMISLNETEIALASSFAANKNRLPWPVSKGFVSEHFGQHEHPLFKGVIVENPGVDIQTSVGESVQSVFDGTVMDINKVPKMGNIVVVQHGSYLTVYAKLASVSVEIGQKIKARQSIGTVLTNSEGVAELNFQVWHNTTKQNPESWLRDR